MASMTIAMASSMILGHKKANPALWVSVLASALVSGSVGPMAQEYNVR
jgi:hypothetical protein